MPIFNYFCTTVWVDDSSLFINIIKKNEELFNCRMKTFLCPLEAFKFLKNYKPYVLDEKFILACKNYDESDLVDHVPTDIDFENLGLILGGDQVEEDISVIVVDQNMPGINGIELCKQLSHLPFKKILLTGAVAEADVISAFNSGVIDGYVRKNSENFIAEINTYIKLLTEKYFLERSLSLLSLLEAGKKLHFSDPKFISFFSEWCRKNNIYKYFLLDKRGNLRVINREGRASNFVVYTDETIKDFIELNCIEDEPNEIFDVISSKKKLPFFGERMNGWEVEISKWEDYLYPCHVIDGREKYYWFSVSVN